jgi:LacI family transcriptional regulator
VKVTSHDVARLAGVSQPTVSRALRDEVGVSPATRTRVREAARQLGYIPSQTGRALSTRRTRRVAVVSAELGNPFYPALIDPLAEALSGFGYRTILVTDRGTDEVELEPLVDGSLDGVVLTTCDVASRLPEELGRRGVPHVLLNRTVRGSPADACAADNRTGAIWVADLLADLGHQRVGAVHGPSSTSTGSERSRWFRRRLTERGVSLPQRYVRQGPFTDTTGYDALTDIARGGECPTALFCANDVIALGVLNAAKDLGIQVPRDLTVVGFDDIGMASWPVFDLTTVGVDLADMARRAAVLLVQRMAAPDGPVRRLRVTPTLIRRGTHARPPLAD